MKLPNGDRAIVEIIKLRDYCLNPAHPRGRHKARVFASSLGITVDNAEYLREVLLTAARTDNAIPGEQDVYGQRYVVDVLVKGLSGQQATVRSTWIVQKSNDVPRLTSCYVL